jgi:hypothetical protein
VMVSQMAIFIRHRHVVLALPFRLAMPSLFQESHSQTGTHIRGEIVRRRIAGRAGRAVGEITGQFHARNQSRVVTFHSPAAVHYFEALSRGQVEGNCDAPKLQVGA